MNTGMNQLTELLLLFDDKKINISDGEGKFGDIHRGRKVKGDLEPNGIPSGFRQINRKMINTT